MRSYQTIAALILACAISETTFAGHALSGRAKLTDKGQGTLQQLSEYDVVWNTPSKNAAGSMPIGNGLVVLNVWTEASTGDVLFYIARDDALSEISRVLKLGQVRIHLSGNPFRASDFSQHLHLRDGTISIAGGGNVLTLFVDSNAQVIHVTGKFPQKQQVTVTLESWRTHPRVLPKQEMNSAWSVHDAPFLLGESADRVRTTDQYIEWYHRNETSVVPELLKNQSLTGVAGAFDPIIHRTFGGLIYGIGLDPEGDNRVTSHFPVGSLDLRIATASSQTPNVASWTKAVEREALATDTPTALARTRDWWQKYWNRSWLFVGGDPKAKEITRGYLLQRYVQGIQGRGVYPIKFNGGSYTVEPAAMGKPFNADYRAWGDCYWYQNVRHMYHPMLEQGDTDMMDPFFKMYESVRLLAESRTKKYHGVSGAYFPETMSVWGTYSGGDYGWDRRGHQPKDVLCPWWQYAWNQGPELVALMLDRWDYTRDPGFLKTRLVPMAKSVLTYFDSRFKKDSAGHIVLDPTQSVETYWQGVVNDMPSTSGLIAITRRLALLPSGLVSRSDQTFFKKMLKACPDLPIKLSAEGHRELSPAQKYVDKTSNVENPELYAVWPFQLVTLGHPKLLAEAKEAYAHRKNQLDVGWGYDGNAAALLGLTTEAARILVKKCENSRDGYRWPATWGPNYDWLPDQNHGGNLLNTANLMLLQGEPLEQGGQIRVLPTWPTSWDVEFKLHAPGNTTVHVVAKSGKIVSLEVTPAKRRKDVVFPTGWSH